MIFPFACMYLNLKKRWNKYTVDIYLDVSTILNVIIRLDIPSSLRGSVVREVCGKMGRKRSENTFLYEDERGGSSPRSI